MQLLTPSQALCLSCVTYWVRVVRKKQGACGHIDSRGRAFTAITAQQCSEWIEANYRAHVSPKTAQLSLRHLVDVGFLVRERRQLEEWKSTYLYSLGEGTEVTCSVPFPEEGKLVSQANGSQEHASITPPSTPDTQHRIEAEAGGRSNGSRPSTSSTNYVSSGLVSRPEMPHGVRSLAEIARLCNDGELPPVVRDKDGFLLPKSQS